MDAAAPSDDGAGEEGRVSWASGEGLLLPVPPDARMLAAVVPPQGQQGLGGGWLA